MQMPIDPEEGTRSSVAGVTGNGELPGVGSALQDQQLLVVLAGLSLQPLLGCVSWNHVRQQNTL